VISERFTSKQQAFLDFVLAHYVLVGIGELDESKLTPLLRLKYHNSIADAVADLGNAADIRKAFTSFQKYLYLERVAV
jgi:type I restriction enzyme R subunit